MVQNVRYSNGPPIHVTLTFEYWTIIPSSIQMVTVVGFGSPLYQFLVFTGRYIDTKSTFKTDVQTKTGTWQLFPDIQQRAKSELNLFVHHLGNVESRKIGAQILGTSRFGSQSLSTGASEFIKYI